MNLPPITIGTNALNVEQIEIVRNALKAYHYELKMERLDMADIRWRQMNRRYVEGLDELIKNFELTPVSETA